MFDKKRILLEAWEWCNDVVIAIPLSVALAGGIVGELNNSDSMLDHIKNGIDRASVTPIETRPLTTEEVFAYRP